MEHQFRLYDFNILNQKSSLNTPENSSDDSDSEKDTNKKTDKNKFIIQKILLKVYATRS